MPLRAIAFAGLCFSDNVIADETFTLVNYREYANGEVLGDDEQYEIAIQAKKLPFLLL